MRKPINDLVLLKPHIMNVTEERPRSHMFAAKDYNGNNELPLYRTYQRLEKDCHGVTRLTQSGIFFQKHRNKLICARSCLVIAGQDLEQLDLHLNDDLSTLRLQTLVQLVSITGT